jgi:hypothetical protein
LQKREMQDIFMPELGEQNERAMIPSYSKKN